MSSGSVSSKSGTRSRVRITKSSFASRMAWAASISARIGVCCWQWVSTASLAFFSTMPIRRIISLLLTQVRPPVSKCEAAHSIRSMRGLPFRIGTSLTMPGLTSRQSARSCDGRGRGLRGRNPAGETPSLIIQFPRLRALRSFHERNTYRHGFLESSPNSAISAAYCATHGRAIACAARRWSSKRRR